jgi:hypothetical protein
VSLSPVRIGSGSGLREGVEALPPSVTSLALLPDIAAAEREGGGAWRIRLGVRRLQFGVIGEERRSVPAVQELCASFDRPGLPCGLEGRVELFITAPAVEAGPQALGAYLGQCAELAGRLRSGGTPSGVELDLAVHGGGSLLHAMLGAVLPAAAPHITSLRLLSRPAFPAGFSHQLGVAFPLLCSLELDVDRARSGGMQRRPLMEAADVEALACLAAPRLRCVGLLCPVRDTYVQGWGAIRGAGSTAAVKALAMGLARPVDAEGHPAGLELFVGVHPSEEGDELELQDALAGAGQDWVHVEWPHSDDGYDDNNGYEDEGGYSD